MSDEVNGVGSVPGRYQIKDSGERSEFAGGMVRDSATDKLDYTSLLFGPMLDRYIAHLTKGREKYPDPEPGVPNWTLAEGVDELTHAKRSLLRHVFQLLRDERDEDHAAAVWFNVNLIEYIRDKMNKPELVPPGTIICAFPGEDPEVAVQRCLDGSIATTPRERAERVERHGT